MASREDATLSIYLEFNKFITHLTSLDNMPSFSFVVTSSIEAANTLLMDGNNKLILVQTRVTQGHFYDASYAIFISLADQLDVNAQTTTRVFSELAKFLPKYATIEVFEAEGLKQPTSVYIPTGCRLVVSDLRQDNASNTQERDNLSKTVLKLTGYLG